MDKKTTAHTQGPWKMLEPDQVRGPEGQFVADCECNRYRRGIDRRNALLIAQAPAMLEALKKVSAMLRAFAESSPGASLTAGSEEATAIETADEIDAIIRAAGGDVA